MKIYKCDGCGKEGEIGKVKLVHQDNHGGHSHIISRTIKDKDYCKKCALKLIEELQKQLNKIPKR